MNYLLTALLAAAVVMPASGKPTLPANAVISRIDVAKNGKTLQVVTITAGGVRETYAQIKRTVQQRGAPGVQAWRDTAVQMDAAGRCGFLVETFYAAEAIKQGVFDSTLAIEQTTNNIIAAIGEVNDQTHVTCNAAKL